MRRVLPWLGPVVGLLLLALALKALSEALGDRSLSDVLAAMRSLPPGPFVLGAALTVTSYLVLTAFDTLALHHVRRPLLWRVLARVSFVAYAFSLNIGIPALSASAVRLRLYMARGLEAADVARVMAFCFATTWVGYCAVAGVVFLVSDVPRPESVVIGPWGLHLVGLGLLAASGGYVLLAWRRRRPLKIGSFEMEMPSWQLALLQILASATQCMVAAGVAWIFLRSAVDARYGEVLGVYLLAAIAGLISHVPGGLGVAEAVFTLSFADRTDAASLLGALLAWRLTYYLVPLALAAAVLGAEELLRARRARRHPA